VAVDGQGNVYVTDWWNHCIEKLDANGNLLATWGAAISGFDPCGVSLDGRGNLYVADGGNKCIRKFSLNGNLLTSWASYSPGNGQFNQPYGVAVSGGKLYVTDGRVLVFNLPTSGLPFLNLLLE
jgi:DNA-binding beta-propeller fold protein YncE